MFCPPDLSAGGSRGPSADPGMVMYEALVTSAMWMWGAEPKEGDYEP